MQDRIFEQILNTLLSALICHIFLTSNLAVFSFRTDIAAAFMGDFIHSSLHFIDIVVPVAILR